MHGSGHMSDSQQAPAPESSGATPTKKTTRVRRISNPLLKKTRKMVQAKAGPVAQTEENDAQITGASPDVPIVTAPEPEPMIQTVVETPVGKEPVKATGENRQDAAKTTTPAEPAAAQPEPPSSNEGDDGDAESGDSPANDEHEWPEPEPASSGRQENQESSKRKRRRKKGKNSQSQQTQNVAQAAVEADPAASVADGDSPQDPAPRPHQVHAPRQRPDPELVAKYAWKIYLAEVSEEGVALIGDHDAKDLARRCFRLAEIFLEEQSRRR